MCKTLLFCGSFLISAVLSSAAVSIAVGTPGNSSLATPTGPSPSFGTLVNFDNLAQSSSPAASLTAGPITISSPDGVSVIPFSSMSSPNEVQDNGADGVANLTIKLNSQTNELGVGVSDLDGVSVTVQALGSNGLPLGSSFVENLNNTNDINGDSYFVLSDTSYDIYGLKITQTASNANYSGLAIDDVQVAPIPEPSGFALFGAGLAVLGGLGLRKRA